MFSGSDRGYFWRPIASKSFLYFLFLSSMFSGIRPAYTSESSTVFSANVPFECSIQNNNIEDITMANQGTSPSSAFYTRFSATADTIEFSGNGLPEVIVDYSQTSGEDASYTFLRASFLSDRGTDQTYIYMQNGSIAWQEGHFPQLFRNPRPLTLYFLADVLDVAGETYEFEVILTCLQRSE